MLNTAGAAGQGFYQNNLNGGTGTGTNGNYRNVSKKQSAIKNYGDIAY